MSSTEFYDNFITYQIDSGINDRIYCLYKKLKQTGLHTNSTILEIGCGIGVLTYLISRIVKKGTIEAMDLSPKSIEYAKMHLNKAHIHFSSSDIVDYNPQSKGYDRILLFDVLEHVMENNHPQLFKKLNSCMNNDSRLLINLPNPNYILFDQKNNPETLQETDQPITIDKLASNLANASLEIEDIETHSVWVKDDYLFIIVKKQREFSEIHLNKERSLFKKIKLKIGREIRKIKYNYPVKH